MKKLVILTISVLAMGCAKSPDQEQGQTGQVSQSLTTKKMLQCQDQLNFLDSSVLDNPGQLNHITWNGCEAIMILHTSQYSFDGLSGQLTIQSLCQATQTFQYTINKEGQQERKVLAMCDLNNNCQWCR